MQRRHLMRNRCLGREEAEGVKETGVEGGVEEKGIVQMERLRSCRGDAL